MWFEISFGIVTAWFCIKMFKGAHEALCEIFIQLKIYFERKKELKEKITHL